jgi:TP901 family phage tail tape measure protein
MSGDKRFGVILAAKVDGYVSSMKAAQEASSNFSTETKSNLEKAGSTMGQVGKAMTLGVTVPLVGLAAASIKASTDFGTSFAQMVGLAGIPAGEVDHLKGSIMNLAKQTGVSAQDLADALYFASSAGLSTADAMSAVSVAAHASAAGLGSAKDVVGLVATALTSYGSANLSAADATDILTKTIKVGRAEPTELASRLGMLLPVASQLGISFEEVGGLTAYLSNVMGDTARTTTSLGGVFRALLAPTTQGRQALLDMGTSMEELQTTISQKGILGGLQLLAEHGFGKNSVALHNLFNDSEAFNGAMALMNDKSGTLMQTMDAVAHHTGATGEAFNAVASTSGFKMKQAMEDIRVSMIQAGDIMAPIVAGIASGVGHIVEKFGNLSKPAQTVVLAFLGLAAAAGPFLMVAGSIVRNLQTLTTVAGQIGPALASVGPYLALAAAAGIIAYKVFDDFTAASRRTAQRTAELVGPLRDATEAVIAEGHAAEGTAAKADGLALSHKALSQALSETGKDGQQITEALGAIGKQSGQTADVLIALKADPVAAMRTLGREAGLTGDMADRLAEKVGSSGKAFWGTAQANEGLTEATKHTGQALETLRDKAASTDIEALATKQLDLATASGTTEAALVKQARAMAGSGASAADVYEKYVGLAAASDKLAAENSKAAATGTDAAAAAGATGDASAEAASQVQELSDAQQKAQQAAEEAESAMMAYRQVLAGSDWGNAAFQGATNAFKNFDDMLFAGARDSVARSKAFGDFFQVVKDGHLSFDAATKSGADTQQALEGISQVLDKQFAQAWANAGGNVDVARQSMSDIANGALADLASGAHLSADQVDQLTAALGLTPEQIETRIQLAGAAEAQLKLQLLQSVISSMPHSVQMDIAQHVIQGDWAGAVAVGQAYMDSHPQDAPVEPTMDPGAAATTVGNIQGIADMGYMATVQSQTDRTLSNVMGEIKGVAVFPYKATVQTGQTGVPQTYQQIFGISQGGRYVATVQTGQTGVPQTYSSIFGIAQGGRYVATIGVQASNGPATSSYIGGIASAARTAVINVVQHGGESTDTYISSIAQKNRTAIINVVQRAVNAIPGMAEGGISPGGLTWVGERGPELVNLPRGARVYPHTQSQTLASHMTPVGPIGGAAAGGGMGASIVQNNVINGVTSPADYLLAQEKAEWQLRMAGKR